MRQVGLPQLFWTMSPYEYLEPYHEWILDEMQKSLRARMHLPAAEALHMAHCLVQITHGLLTGVNKQKTSRAREPRWRKHILSSKDESGTPVKLVVFTRLEFQDGSRKPGTERYEGSGRPHVHVLIFADDLDKAKLEEFVKASAPDGEDAALLGKVLCSQKDRNEECKWPIYEGAEGWDEDTGTLRLRHTEEDEDQGVHRAYFIDIMDGHPCHQDLQISDGEALLLQYVTKYCAKFSDSSYDEWLADEASANAVARRVCYEYHPYEPEMLLQLCGQLFKQWHISTVSRGKRDIQAPWPNMGDEQLPAYVKNYMQCLWRREDMSLLEYLRKTTDGGEILAWIKKPWRDLVLRSAHEAYVAAGGGLEFQAYARGCNQKNFAVFVKDGGPNDFRAYAQHHAEALLGDHVQPLNVSSLDDFANAYVMRGEKVAAANMVYRFNDKFYGQWLMLHVPFRSLEDFQDKEVERLVPKKYRWFATALRLCGNRERVPAELHDFWTRPDKIRCEMKMEAHTQDFVDDVVALLEGQTELVRQYLQGAIRRDEEPAEVLEGAGRQRRNLQENVVFNARQERLERDINRAVDRALAANHTDCNAAADEARDEAWKKNKPILALGKPGTGKTTVVKRSIRRACQKGARVLFALPTAQLASRMKQALGDVPGVEIATCHAAFKLDQPDAEGLAAMTMYDFVVVDEISLLSEAQFERLMKLWRVAEKVPAFVILGDMYQLPGLGDTRPWNSRAWSECRRVTLHESWRCKDSSFQKTLDALRVDRPSERLLHDICRGHKAWYTDEPTLDDIRELLRRHPETTIVTCRRVKAEMVNALAVEALFENRRPLAEIDGEVDVNSANYTSEGKFREDRKPIPAKVPIYVGMKVYLTQNVRKEDDFVNGMECTVERFTANDHGGSLFVRTKTGHRIVVTKWTNTKVPTHAVRHFPVRLGYAGTIHKVQGDEFSHITIWLDRKCAPAAGYTALSRVQTQRDYLLGGKLTREHFVPATWASSWDTP